MNEKEAEIKMSMKSGDRKSENFNVQTPSPTSR